MERAIVTLVVARAMCRGGTFHLRWWEIVRSGIRGFLGISLPKSAAVVEVEVADQV